MHAGVWAEQGRHASRHGAALRASAAVMGELEADGWVVLHDLERPGRRLAGIDHIAVGPGGIVVVDTKDWSGTVDVQDGVLRQNGVPRDRECELAQACAAAVTAWLAPPHRTAVRPVICLVGQPTPARQPTLTAVYGVSDLATALRALPVRLHTGEIRAAADQLRRTLAGGSTPCQLTTAALDAAWLDLTAAPGGPRTRWQRLRGRLGRLTRIRRTQR